MCCVGGTILARKATAAAIVHHQRRTIAIVWIYSTSRFRCCKSTSAMIRRLRGEIPKHHAVGRGATAYGAARQWSVVFAAVLAVRWILDLKAIRGNGIRAWGNHGSYSIFVSAAAYGRRLRIAARIRYARRRARTRVVGVVYIAASDYGLAPPALICLAHLERYRIALGICNLIARQLLVVRAAAADCVWVLLAVFLSKPIALICGAYATYESILDYRAWGLRLA